MMEECVSARLHIGGAPASHRQNGFMLKCTLKLALPGTGLMELSACAGGETNRAGTDKPRQETAIAMWKERCQKAGEFIHQTEEDVEGVYLLKVRPKGVNFADQFELNGPYGSDVSGMGVIETFLNKGTEPGKEPLSTAKGYRYVVAKDMDDGQLYRFTGRIEEPWQTHKSYLKGYTRFVVDKSPPPHPLPRYGVTWDDISTREEREYWIAGSSLKVIDLQTNQVIAERVGYMVDWAQGSKAGNRSPWLFAADTACPAFRDPSLPRVQPAFSALGGQTYRFVSKVLKPKQ